jgi:hypothetical protein
MVKVVQTSLEEEEYERFRKVARYKKLTIKEATKEAIVTWAKGLTPLDAEDDFFRLEPADFGDPELSTKIDEVLYGKKVGK